MLDINNEDHRKLIAYCLYIININYSAGDISFIDFVDMKVVLKTQYRILIRRFRINGMTIYFAGHQVTLNEYDMNDSHKLNTGEIILERKPKNMFPEVL